MDEDSRIARIAKALQTTEDNPGRLQLEGGAKKSKKKTTKKKSTKKKTTKKKPAKKKTTKKKAPKKKAVSKQAQILKFLKKLQGKGADDSDSDYEGGDDGESESEYEGGKKEKSKARSLAGKKAAKTNAWVIHVNRCAKKRGITYKEALMDPRTKKTYRSC